MRIYIPLNEEGQRVKEALKPILALWERYRALRDTMTRMADPYALFEQENDGIATVWMQLQMVEARLHEQMRANQRMIGSCPLLTPMQLMVLTMRYVQGCDWPTVAERTGLERARLYQEHRVGLNTVGRFTLANGMP